jgi:Domain of unknown function (DUF4345)
VFIWAIRALGVGCIIAGLTHVVLGLGADTLLGAAKIGSDATRDSQDRFYGAIFAVYGFLMFLFVTDLRRYGPALKTLLAVFFLGGVARLVSMIFTGLPSPYVIGLLATELAFPPLLWWWLNRASHDIR